MLGKHGEAGTPEHSFRPVPQCLEENLEDLESISDFIILVTAITMLHNEIPQHQWQRTSIYFFSSWVCELAGLQLVWAGPGWTPGSGLGSGLLPRASLSLDQQLSEA